MIVGALDERSHRKEEPVTPGCLPVFSSERFRAYSGVFPEKPGEVGVILEPQFQANLSHGFGFVNEQPFRLQHDAVSDQYAGVLARDSGA